MDRHRAKAAALIDTVLGTPGVVDVALRRSVFGDSRVPDPWQSYVDKVREESHKISDRDLEDLASAGQPEDAIFEITVAAAIGAAKRHLDAGLAALDGEG